MQSRTLWFLLMLVVGAAGLRADDGAASVAVGGVVVMTREPRIVMAKEVLRISSSKIVVDYDFRNDSDEDITTEVAFPIPDYEHDFVRVNGSANFDDFRLWVNGSPVRYQVETRAFLKDKEYTQLLRGMGVDIASFGHSKPDDEGSSRDIKKLTAAQQAKLERVGVVAGDEPLWVVRKKYHWQQTFPAHKVVHIRHQYSPYLGFTNSIVYGMGDNPDPESVEEIKNVCVDGPLRATLVGIVKSSDREASLSWVDFVLTTANTWKTPIEDFTLIVERPHWKDWKTKRDLGNYVSFCWDGPVTKIDSDHFSAHLQNLVPAKELRIGYFEVETRRVP